MNAIPSNCIVTKLDRQQMQGNDVMSLLYFDIYSLRHRKCGVRGFIHELFVSKPERARYERVRAFDTNNE